MSTPKLMSAKSDMIIDQRHPKYAGDRWQKYRLAYEGGEEFIEAFMYRYSKREGDKAFKERKKISYNPGHAKSAINIIRNSLAVKLPEVVREGDQRYLDACESNVDSFRASMSTFMAVDVIPMLLVHEKRFVMLDAPPKAPGATLGEDRGMPYMWCLSAEDVLSWHYNEEGQIDSILVREWADEVSEESGLITGSCERFRLMRKLEEGMEYRVGKETFKGPSVLIRTFDTEGKESPPEVMDWDRVPVAEFTLVDSLMTDIADMQITLLNLASSDISFLWKGNFPIFVKEVDRLKSLLKPRAAKRTEQADQERVDYDADVLGDSSPSNVEAGVNSGIGYEKGQAIPSFIAPPTGNLQASMDKQTEIARLIRVMVDLALTSLSVSAVEQSGKSKEADRVGEEAGLAYIGSVLEAGEREVAAIYHMLLGVPDVEVTVRYPKGFSVKTPEQRQLEAKSLMEMRSAVRSEIYNKSISKRIADLMMKGFDDSAELESAKKEIDETLYFDDNKERAEIIGKDVAAGLLSAPTGTILRGYPEDEADKAAADKSIAIDAMSGGSNIPPADLLEEQGLDGQSDPNADPNDPSKPNPKKNEQSGDVPPDETDTADNPFAKF